MLNASNIAARCQANHQSGVTDYRLAVIVLLLIVGVKHGHAADPKSKATASKAAGSNSRDSKTSAATYPALVQIEEDPGLPRVLVIGDSISMGYLLPLRDLLKDKANVQHPPENCRSSRRIVQQIDKYLGSKHWDVIQFNCGIHDLTYLNEAGKVAAPDQGGKAQVPLDEYRANLEKIVARLKKSGAVLIWCTTTPMDKPAAYRKPGDVDRYNAVAEKIMLQQGIRITDLHGKILEHDAPKWTPEGVHFTPEGYRELASYVAPGIEQALAETRK
jgi:hypothetical protein